MNKFRGLEEKEIGDELDLIARGEKTENESLNGFRAKNINNSWFIVFNNKKVDNYTIKVKHTKEVRSFRTLDAVASWMRKMEISEFKVIL